MIRLAPRAGVSMRQQNIRRTRFARPNLNHRLMNKFLLAVMALVWLVPAGVRAQGTNGVFFDDFTGNTLNTGSWLYAEKAWGDGGANGGVVHDNVSVTNGCLRLEGHGNNYTGSVQGVDNYGKRIAQVTLVGAAVATTNYYASGKYEVRMQLPPNYGAATAAWTFHYEEVYQGLPLYSVLAAVGGVAKTNFLALGLSPAQVDSLWADLSTNKAARSPYITPVTTNTATVTEFFRAHVWDVTKLDLVNDYGQLTNIFYTLYNGLGLEVEGSDYDGYYLVRNQEIDIEMPTALAATPANISYTNARFNTWVGETGGNYTANYDALGAAMNDGQFHTFRFDWHTGDTNQTPRVEFYVDNVPKQTNYTSIPTIAGRFWVGLWFPSWTGTPAFDTEALLVDWVRITPFHEAADQWVPETYPNDGWWYPATLSLGLNAVSGGGPVQVTATVSQTVTNHVNIYCCTNGLAAGNWFLCASNLAVTGTNLVSWTDTNAVAGVRFYRGTLY